LLFSCGALLGLSDDFGYVGLRHSKLGTNVNVPHRAVHADNLLNVFARQLSRLKLVSTNNWTFAIAPRLAA
jgi:hypothetical protein